MFDTRCWSCAKINEKTCDIITIHNTEYKSKGIFVCPVCGAVNDVSEDTYTIIISREYKDGYLITRYLTQESKLKQKYPEISPDGFEGDTEDLFEDEPFGKYLCEVYYCWYICGGEEPEYDLATELFSIEPLKVGTKVLDISGWVDVKRNPIPLDGGGNIEPLIGQFTRAGSSTDIKEYDMVLFALRGYKLKFTMKFLDTPENRKEEEHSEFMSEPKDIKPEIGAEVCHDGWVDVQVTPWKLADGTTFDDNITGLYTRVVGATNIAVYDHYIEHLRGYKLQVTLEVIDIPENRNSAEAPLDKRGTI